MKKKRYITNWQALFLLPIIFLISLVARVINYRIAKNPQKWKKIYNTKFIVTKTSRFMTWFVFISGYKISVRNQERMNDLDNTIIISNHSTVFDVPAITKYFPKEVSWITKTNFTNSWLYGPILKLVKAFPIDRTSPKTTAISLIKAGRAFRQGRPLCVFPEGRLSHSQNMLPFKEEVFRFIVGLKANVLPIKIKYRFNKKNEDGTSNKKMIVIIGKKVKYKEYQNMSLSQITKHFFKIVNETK